jgi:hypothetical protein
MDTFYLRLLHRLPLNERARRRRAVALCARIADLRDRTTRRHTRIMRRPEAEGSVHWRIARTLAFVGWVDPEQDAHRAAGAESRSRGRGRGLDPNPGPTLR